MAGFAPGVGAHADMFLKIDGIEGESTDQKHKGEIELQSWSFGATQPGSAGHGGGAGIGKTQLHDFSIVKFADKASPKLFEACTTGKHIPTVKLTCRKAGGDQQEFLKITMKEAIVSNFTQSGSGGGSLPMDNLSLNFTTIEMEYGVQNEKGALTGSVKAGWDAAKNVKI